MKKTEDSTMFLTETNENFEDLLKRAPLTFKYIPSEEIMRKLILRATKLKEGELL